MDGRNRSDITPGNRVRVVQKQDQRSGKLTEGIVRDILTNSPTHPHGIKVRLTSGVVGRVKETSRRCPMTPRAKALADKLQAFNERVIAVVEGMNDADWKKNSFDEDWPLGVVARHIGAGHYAAIDLAKMIIAGQPLPEFTMDGLARMANQQAEKHAGCTKTEVLSILKESGKKMVDTVSGWRDEEMDKKAFFAAFDSEASVAQIVEWVVLNSAGGHLQSMERTLAR